MRSLIAKLIFVCFSFASIHLSAAPIESAICERAGITRLVELRVKSPSGVPCSVVYLRPDEGRPEQTLWNAKNDAQFCNIRYQDFLVKLENKLNWVCSSPNSTASSSENSGTVLIESESFGNSSTTPPKVDVPSRTAAPSRAVETSKAEVHSNAASPSKVVVSSNAVEPSDQLTPPSDPTLSIELTPPEKTVIKANTNDQKTTAISRHASIEQKELQQTLEEPRVQRALPVTRRTVPSTDFIDVNKLHPNLTLKTIQEFIPSAIYTADSVFPHEGDVEICPADGYFVWNTRNPDRPIFEMGLDFEFAVDFNHIQSGNNTGTITRVASNQSQKCNVQIEYSACQHPDSKLGAPLWTTNDKSFRCDTSSSNNKSRAVAVFQNRTIQVATAKSCIQQMPIVHMALAPLGETITAQSVRQANGLELIIVQQTISRADRLRTLCRYTRS